MRKEIQDLVTVAEMLHDPRVIPGVELDELREKVALYESFFNIERIEQIKLDEQKLWTLMEEYNHTCCFYTATGCIHPIKITELCDCPCNLFWHPSFSKPTVESQQLRNKTQSIDGQPEGEHLAGPDMGVGGSGHAGKPISNDHSDQRSTSQPSGSSINSKELRTKSK